jgi:protoheme IX farnesyltransferase
MATQNSAPDDVSAPKSAPVGEYAGSDGGSTSANSLGFQKLSFFAGLLTIFIVGWGGLVRASFSGAGCGDHWPFCNGTFKPDLSNTATLIEFLHRATSGAVLLLIAFVAVRAFQVYGKGSPVRRYALFSLFFMLVEAGVGAGIVLLKLVAHEESVRRTISTCIHIGTTFALLAALTATYLASKGFEQPRWSSQGAVGWALVGGIFGALVVSITGACSALGHMLKPTDNVIGAALQQGSHYLYKLQLSHPFVACTVGLYMLFLVGFIGHFRPSDEVKRAGRAVIILFISQIGLGLLNIQLKAPIWIQVLHLVLADGLWVAIAAMTYFALAPRATHVEKFQWSGAEAEPRATGKALLKQYIALTKPRVISLLLFTTMVTMFIPAKGWPGLGLFTWVFIGGYLMAGAANAINMVIDRDIDGTMKRTSKRPTVTQSIPSEHALAFGLGTALLSFGILWAGANLLTAMMALAGYVFYIVIYTLLLKRRTWQNIVIGGAAGAFPPLVGWAAVANELPVFAWVLFGVIFLWTPVHFWALALLIKDDYQAAGVPMLPVVRGDRYTVQQIIFYMVLTVMATLAPFVMKDVGWIALSGAIVLNAILGLFCFQLWKQIDRPRASRLFHYSMLYLALWFAFIALDRVLLS